MGYGELDGLQTHQPNSGSNNGL